MCVKNLALGLGFNTRISLENEGNSSSVAETRNFVL